ncbi:Serine/threonine-protein kinase N2, partial [Cladochytrium tenue]
ADPTRRLGGGRLGAEEIKRHSYFAGLDWDAMLKKAVPPPWKPQPTSPTDVSGFDEACTKLPAVLTPTAPGGSGLPMLLSGGEFADFDFVAEWAVDSRARFAAMGAARGGAIARPGPG